MTRYYIYIAGTTISFLIFIAILGRTSRKKNVKLFLLIMANIIFISSIALVSYRKNAALIPLSLTVLILDIAVIRRIISKEHPDQELFNAWQDDPSNWKAGVFYYNPKDKRIFPPKRIEGFGWTVNFANPYSVLVMILILAFVLYIIIFKPFL